MTSRHKPCNDISDMGRAAEETEIQRAANQQLIEEGRIIRHQELEKHRREEENAENNIRSDLSLRVGSGSNSRYSSQRSSVDLASATSASTRNTDVRDMRNQISQLEEKIKSTMLANVQLDNDKQLLKYEVDLLKDKIEDLTDSYASLNKTYLENKRELSYQRMQVAELQHRLDFARHQIEARDHLLIEHNLVLLGGSDVDDAPPLHQSNDEKPNKLVNNKQDSAKSHLMNGLQDGDYTNSGQNYGNISSKLPEMALITKHTAELLNSLPETELDKRIQYLFNARQELSTRVEDLELQLAEERKRLDTKTTRYDSRSRLNGPSSDDLKHELQQYRTQAQEYKLKYQEAAQKISTLESDIIRLEGQTKRYKTIASSCEQQEEILKQDKRKFQRELREALTELEDLKSQKACLQRALDKFNRSSAVPSGLPTGSVRHGGRESSVNR